MNELIFRVIFSALWIIFVIGLALVRYSTRELGGKQPSDQPVQHERRLYIITRALVAPFWWVGIILFLVFPSWIVFLSIPLPDWFRLIMVVLCALSILLTLWGWRTLGKNWVHCLNPSEFQHRKAPTLVTSELYHYVRHPMYLGAFTFFVAQALVAANWVIILPALITTTYFYAQISRGGGDVNG